ncbi:hypothetical protein O1611_g3204 [Lasiodiplodia mahajangana]|uniref:Uncharacterized protein n=1 Tax=Lasiodiplodia mahajangana TaxID=1108764 RepID=A0ACC2JSM8_9PEZI|nr:hypothetical protein O1611_g3204 [Lasiodiplodia mahajangana]
MAYHNKKSHDFEIVKSISLRQVDPWAIMMFRETGHMTVSLPEFLFDIDFPGHYCRRIASVSLTIPCVVGPYTSLNCTLRLTQHRYRVNSYLGPGYLENGLDDTRFRDDNIPISAVAIGSPTAGSFSLDFARDRYSPFEGAGVISTWQIDLPPKFRQFDYRTISDVVLQLRYTALDGGLRFAGEASKAVQEKIGKPPQSSQALLSMLINVPSDYATSWYSFRLDLENGRAGTLHMPGMAALLPFWTQQLKIMVDSISVIFVPPPTDDNSALEKMKIAEYPQVKWTPTRGFGDDSSVDDCTILKSDKMSKDMSQDWTISIPNDGGVKLVLGAVWILVYYYAG